MTPSLISSAKHLLRYVIQNSGLRILIAPLAMFLVRILITKDIKGKHIIKGSITTKNWIPFVSDIDINIVEEAFQQHHYQIMKRTRYLKKWLRLDISVKVFPTRIDELYFNAGMYYHYASPWVNDPDRAKRRNLWLCLREIIKRYPDQIRDPSRDIYIPEEKQKRTWLNLAIQCNCEYLAAAIKTREDLSFKEKISAQACAEVFWQNYLIKLQIIKHMPQAWEYFGNFEGHEARTFQPAEILPVAPLTLDDRKELQQHYKMNALPVFPRGHEDLYGFLPKVGIFAVKLDAKSTPKLAILQWAIETMVIFEDNPYIFDQDTESKRRLEECIYQRIPRLKKLIYAQEESDSIPEELTNEVIQQGYRVAEDLLLRAMQLNELVS